VPTAHLDGKHVVFGEVLAGKSVGRYYICIITSCSFVLGLTLLHGTGTAVREIEHTPTQTGDLPILDCVITKAGQLSPGEDDGANAPKDVQTPGDKYEDYPEDEDKIDVNSMDVVINAAKDIREGGNVFFKAGKYGEALRQYKSKHCLRAVTRQATNSMAIHRESQVP
jgi:peptidyl-prolyl isomerase D